jgi:two-component system chemotaxis response regulator CheY
MGIRVLVADDAAFMRQMIREIIEPEGFEVVGEASDGVEVVESYHQLEPDLVMMDIVMCSALGQETLVMEALQSGAKDFIVKPFKPDAVLSTLKKVSEKEL